nr:hypothetical protein [Lactobacillus taiwanensis]
MEVTKVNAMAITINSYAVGSAHNTSTTAIFCSQINVIRYINDISSTINNLIIKFLRIAYINASVCLNQVSKNTIQA